MHRVKFNVESNLCMKSHLFVSKLNNHIVVFFNIHLLFIITWLSFYHACFTSLSCSYNMLKFCHFVCRFMVLLQDLVESLWGFAILITFIFQSLKWSNPTDLLILIVECGIDAWHLPVSLTSFDCSNIFHIAIILLFKIQIWILGI